MGLVGSSVFNEKFMLKRNYNCSIGVYLINTHIQVDFLVVAGVGYKTF